MKKLIEQRKIKKIRYFYKAVWQPTINKFKKNPNSINTHDLLWSAYKKEEQRKVGTWLGPPGRVWHMVTIDKTETEHFSIHWPSTHPHQWQWSLFTFAWPSHSRKSNGTQQEGCEVQLGHNSSWSVELTVQGSVHLTRKSPTGRATGGALEWLQTVLQSDSISALSLMSALFSNGVLLLLFLLLDHHVRQEEA